MKKKALTWKEKKKKLKFIIKSFEVNSVNI